MKTPIVMKNKARHDIQVLRGVAVLAVLFFHANLFEIPGGYLGVDLFFVVSGFLITSIILKGLEGETFSFSQFYIRRAKRLLPAAYVTLIITTLLSGVLLTRSEWNDFLEQIFGSLTFTSNFLLMLQTGYFESQAESKPLLHMWSLSLEEQYYIALPILLSLLALKDRGWVLLALFTASLAGCFILISGSQLISVLGLSVTGAQKISFYMLPFRAWELLGGSICAWLMLQKPNLVIPKVLKFIALFIVIFGIFFPIYSVHPRIDAVVVVFAAAFMLLGSSDWLQPGRISKPIAFFGDISYSLYLVHWPLFALTNSVYLGSPPKIVNAFLILLALVLAFLQYKYVEQPYRHRWSLSSSSAAIWLSFATLLVFATPLTMMIWNRDSADLPDFSEIRMANPGLGLQCAQLGDVHEPLTECATSDSPTVAVWGDSYAMHLIPGLLKELNLDNSLIQITKSSCGPVSGLAQIEGSLTTKWAQNCIAFNQSAINYMINSSSIKYIVISSPFTSIFENSGQSFLLKNQIQAFSPEISKEQFSLTIDMLRSAGKIPIIVAPPPSGGFDIGACLEREHDELLILGRDTCSVSESYWTTNKKEVIEALSELETSQDITIVWPSTFMCIDGNCLTKMKETYLYRDTGHFSISGSAVVLELLGLANLINSASQ